MVIPHIPQSDQYVLLTRNDLLIKYRSTYVVGYVPYSILPQTGDSVTFTVWFALLQLPIFPVATWCARYLGNKRRDAFTEMYLFIDAEHMPGDSRRSLRTISRGVIVLLIVAVISIVLIILKSYGIQFGLSEKTFFFLYFLCPGAFFIYSLHRRERTLDQFRTSNSERELHDICWREDRLRPLENRRDARVVFSIMIIIGGGALAKFFTDDMLPALDQPAPYFFYALALLGILGLFGVNIWWGTPLDKRRDNKIP